MTQNTTHNPDRYIVDFRKMLSQDKKRIGFLIGAGAPASVKVDQNGNLDKLGTSLIPTVVELTNSVIDSLSSNDKNIINVLFPASGESPNIEAILTRIRQLSQAIGTAEIHGLNGDGYKEIAENICRCIGKKVAAKLPDTENSYTKLISWIGGTHREHPIEIFTPNYDLLLEEALERAKLPYFDGFSGSHEPFFDPASISSNDLPKRWSRIWKIHGSLGWDLVKDTVVRRGGREATQLIYPDHMKYAQINRQPYSSLFERLRKFLTTPDSLLICAGFSFTDSHITSVLEESLAANAHTAIIAFQHRSLTKERLAVKLALKRSNTSIYAPDGAVISGIESEWKLGEHPSDEWQKIRDTFWDSSSNNGTFLLGDFGKLAHFIALSHANDLTQDPKPAENEELGFSMEDIDNEAGS